MKSVYTILLHWNNFRCTDFCITSLRGVTYENHKVIVVDNGSTDNSLDLLKSKYPECIYLALGENHGFARGTNRGMKAAFDLAADYILVLNNDVEVSPGFIEPLVEACEGDDKVGMATSKILYRDKRDLIWQAGGKINHWTISPEPRGYDEIDKGQYNTLEETKWASGACSLVSRRLIETIGYFDEKFFFGQEEWDYSTTSIKKGFKILYVPDSVVYHEIAGSTNKRPSLNAYQNVFNKLVYANKHLPFVLFYVWLPIYFLYVILFFPKKHLHNDGNDYFIKTAKIAAIWSFKSFFKSTHITADHLNIIEMKLSARYRNYSSNSLRS